MVSKREFKSQFVRESFSSNGSEVPIYGNRGRTLVCSVKDEQRSEENLNAVFSEAREKLRRAHG